MEQTINEVLRQVLGAGGQVFQEIKLTTIELNVTIDEKIFDKKLKQEENNLMNFAYAEIKNEFSGKEVVQ